MKGKLLLFGLAALLVCGLASGQGLVELFQKAKGEIKAGSWGDAVKTLAAGVPYQQVDFEFVTRKGYGENVLQRDPAAVNTMDRARQSVDARPAS